MTIEQLRKDFGKDGSKRRYITQVGAINEIDKVLEKSDIQEAVETIKRHYTMCDGYFNNITIEKEPVKEVKKEEPVKEEHKKKSTKKAPKEEPVVEPEPANNEKEEAEAPSTAAEEK